MFGVHGQINKQMVCIHVTLHLMASVQPPSSFLPVPRRLSLMQIDLTWPEPVASSAGLPAPGSLSQSGDRAGDKRHAAPRRKIPEGAVTLHSSPSL